MLCSKCSEIVTPIVAVDIDGTLADYHGHFLRFAADYLNKGMVPLLQGSQADAWYSGAGLFREYCMDLFDISYEEFKQTKLAYRQGGMKRTMPIFGGAKDLCRRIRSAGAELWLTTTRPYLSLDNVLPDTIEWLDRHQIAFDGMLFDEDKYTQLAERVDPVRVVAVLDDLYEMYDMAAYTFGINVPILIKGAFNGGVVRRNQMVLQDAAAEVVRRIFDWEAEYGEGQHGERASTVQSQ